MNKAILLSLAVGVLGAALLPSLSAHGASQTQPAKAAVPYITVDQLPVATPETCPYQKLVGKKIMDIDLVSFRPLVVRVIYPGTPLSNDYDPKRINIICDPKDDRVLEVRCG